VYLGFHHRFRPDFLPRLLPFRRLLQKIPLSFPYRRVFLNPFPAAPFHLNRKLRLV
jgi:hypothetical protein